MNEKQSPTFADFNPTGEVKVDEIKKRTDELIGLIEEYRVTMSSAGQRRAALAITNYEQAAMWAVKSIFSK